MITTFISLQWKSFVRSASFKQSLAVKIIMGLFAAMLILEFLAFGVGAFFMLEDVFPDEDPFVLINRYMAYWLLFDLFYRFMLQKLPVMNVQPLMVLPIKRSKIIHFLLSKSLVSFFNIAPLFFFVPFTVVLLFKGYAVLGVLAWFLGFLSITCCVNFINFLINKNNYILGIIVAIVITVVGLKYYSIYDVSLPLGNVFYALYTTPYFVVLPVALAILLYMSNYTLLRTNFYLDGVVAKKVKEVEATDLSWLNRFGNMAPFLKNDVKMIWRNKRPKQVVIVSVAFIFYGLLFYTGSIEMYDNAIMKGFASVFITGGFLMTFGQHVPSWDSEYFKLMMSQNIQYKTYLESKWILMIVATIVSFVLSIPYLYFGVETFAIILGGAVFNIGINSFLVLWGGVYNKTAIQLNEKAKAFSNTQAFNGKVLLISLPKMLLPIALFAIPYFITKNTYAGAIVLGVSGLLGLLFKNQILKGIEKLYQKEKYKTIKAYASK